MNTPGPPVKRLRHHSLNSSNALAMGLYRQVYDSKGIRDAVKRLRDEKEKPSDTAG